MKGLRLTRAYGVYLKRPEDMMGQKGSKIDFLETQPAHLTNAENSYNPESKHTCKRVSTQITSYTEVLKNAGTPSVTLSAAYGRKPWLIEPSKPKAASNLRDESPSTTRR